MSATVTYVGESKRRVSKRLYWASEDADGIWRGEGPGRWRKPEDFGEPNVKPPNKITIAAHETPDLRSRYELRQKLAASQNQFLLLGIKAPTVDGLVARNQKTLLDGPRGQLVLDLEKIAIDGDVVERDSEIPDILFGLFEAAGLDWLIADCVIHLSSSHGVLDRREIRCHAEWQLETPLTIAEQKRVAAHINSKLGGDFADSKIYESARLFFSGPAELISRHFEQGKGILPRDHKPPAVTRVRYVNRGSPRIAVPAEALAGAPVAIPALRRPTAKAIGKLQPGNVHNYMVRRSMATVKGTPWHLLPAAKEELRQALAAGVAALDESEKLEARLAHVTGAAFETSWAGALAKRYPWGDWHSLPLSAPDERGLLDVATARLHLASHVESAAREAFSVTNLIPRHTHITAMPGLGKSQAAVDAITTARAVVNRTAYLTPSIKLSDELMRRHPLHGSDNLYLSPMVRHHVGRDKVCKDDTFGPIGLQLGKIGRSPAIACAHCPRRDACPWPAQQGDTGAGLVFGQHAHATSSMRRTKAGKEGAPNFTIIDEALIGTLLSPNKLPRHIKALRRLNLKASIAGHRDGTADLRGFRDEVLAALELTRGPLEVNRVSHWAQTVTLRKATDDAPAEMGPRVDAAIRTESWAASLYDRQLKAALADMTERRARGLSDLSPRRQFQRAVRHLEASAFFAALYRAIKATLDVIKRGADRKTVFGVYASESIVSVHTRHPLPDAVLNSHGLWLDGTPNRDIWERFFGDARIDFIEPLLRVRPGAYHLTQYADRPYGRNFWRNEAHLDRLYRFILERAAHHRPKTLLVIVQKPVKLALEGRPLPANVAIHNFKGIRGLDGFKDAPCVIVAGRPMLDQRDLENQTEALHFDDATVSKIAPGEGRYHTAKRQLQTTRGPVTINAECHPDARAEALREQLVDKEVVQAVHRLRLFDRTEANPAEIHVFGQADTGLIVHEMADWQDADRSADEIIRAGGVFPQSTDLASRAALGLLFGRARSTVQIVVEGYLKLTDSLCKYKKHEDEREVLIKANRSILSCRWVEYSVKIAEAPNRRRVKVDVSRWPDAAAAIAEALRVEVVSLSPVLDAMSDNA